MTHLNDLKADFSQAYVRAVAHAAGYFVSEANRARDATGVDLEIFERGPLLTRTLPRLDVQLKATADPLEGDPIPFDLTTKNYDELRHDNHQLPRILVVVALPPTREEWLTSSEQELTLRKCGYWRSLVGLPATSNKATVRVTLPRQPSFDVATLQAIMNRIAKGELP